MFYKLIYPIMQRRVLLLFFSLNTATTLGRTTQRGKVMEKIFDDYSSDFRPVKNESNVVKVKVDFDLRILHELDERKQRLVTSGWFSFTWFDEYLTWDQEEYSNFSLFSIDNVHLWKPDAVIFNGFSDFLDFKKTSFRALVKHTGEIQWAPALTFDTHCVLDVTFYPFDSQRCTLEIVVWTEPEENVLLVPARDNISLRTFVDNGEWEITETYVEHVSLADLECCEGRYSRLMFHLILTRRRAYSIINILIPTISESILCSVVFLVPSESGERMSLSITVLLSYAVFLGATIDSLPHTSLHISIMSIYMVSVLLLGTVSVFLTGVSLYLYHRPGKRALTRAESPQTTKGNGAEKLISGMPPGQPNDEMDCREQSRRFDRICFAVVSTLSIFSIPIFLTVITSQTPSSLRGT